MKEEIKKLIERGMKFSYSVNKINYSIWKSDIRLTYWINNVEYDNLDEAVDDYLKIINIE